jgi:superfamily II DNA or RNA helicase
MIEGIYEEIVTKLVKSKLEELDPSTFYIKKSPIDKSEAAELLTLSLTSSIRYALTLVKTENQLEHQISIANKIIQYLKEELKHEDFEDDLIESEGKILKAVFSRVDNDFSDLDLRLHQITPYTRLSHSELFTGGNAGISLESELRKEILSSNKIDLLVSFIKWKGIRILEKELIEFTEKGGHLRVITTTYIGATDYKAIEFLSTLKNTEIKISYNNKNERLHAKAYLFLRNTGYHTGYVGSSNFSRSALTDGLEWNIKITTKEVPHLISKFQKTFDTYWQNNEFERYNDQIDAEKLKEALSIFRTSPNQISTTFFDLKPFTYQNEILEKLEAERTIHYQYKNLVVAATGTGKTVVSAFDYKRFKNTNPKANLLFIAHRKEILTQAMSTFRGVLKDNNFGQLWVDGEEPDSYQYVFASVQTLKNRMEELRLSADYFDFIIVDEVHHIPASSYRPVINYFTPKILLGLTATPERLDREDILKDFNGRIAAEIRLPEALNGKILCPFQYFGISDSIDLSNVGWEKGRYIPSELSSLYTANDRRVSEIIAGLEKYTADLHENRALGFCATIEHAKFMAEKFSLAGLKADCLTSDNSEEREVLRKKLVSKEINYLFVRDIFNEGVDIPEIDTVLFLRPTESLTIFLQQLGRGLRLSEGKDCLTVLDFVGNSRPEYDFEQKFRALVGKTNHSVLKEVQDDFPKMPLGCSIILEKKAKEIILANIANATNLNRNSILQKITNYRHQTNLPFSLPNFLHHYQIPIQAIYNRASWKRLCFEAGLYEGFDDTNEVAITRAIKNKWLSTSCLSYFSFIKRMTEQHFKYNESEINEEERMMLLMLHYDVWQNEGGFSSLKESITSIGKNPTMVEEMIEVLDYLIDRIDFIENNVTLPYAQPLKLHGRYTRDQILAAFRISSFEKRSSNREGLAENKELNTELLFVDLVKSEEDFSPTTLYNDYAISDYLFHWQSQNKTSPNTPKGKSYINHLADDKIILLFVRERAKDEFGNTMGYVFLGKINYEEFYGSKPMSITWRLDEPIPNYLWSQSAKLSVG